MEREDLLATAFSTPFPDSMEAGYSVRQKLQNCFAAVSREGRAVLLVPLTDSELPPGRRLGQVRVTFPGLVAFDIDGTTSTAKAAVVECLEPELLKTFCVFVRDICRQLPNSQSGPKELLAVVASWDQLLRAHNALGGKEELGLWGELTLLAQLPKIDRAIASWRGPEGSFADFIGGGVAVECKTSLNQGRHRVSHAQLTAADAEKLEIYLGSLWAAEDAHQGRSLPELIEALMALAQDEDALWKKLYQAGYSEAHKEAYSRRFGLLDQVRLYAMKNVPRVHSADPGISKITYEVNLMSVAAESDQVRAEVYGRLVGEAGETDGGKE